MQMREDQFNALWTVGAVLLPLIPAYVLFKILHSTGKVGGPFQGLKLELGGPAALYLVVFVYLMRERPKDLNHYHTWTVSGQIAWQHPPNEADPNVNDILVRFIPPRLGVMNQGRFSWEIPVKEDLDGTFHFPDLQLDLRDYVGVTVPLAGGGAYGSIALKADYDQKTHTVVLRDPITLQSTKLGAPYAGIKGW
jgi:hypothetical protein